MAGERDPAGWAAGVLLAVTGVPREQRALVQQLIEAAGGRYSPNLSRRCTHLAVPSSGADAPPAALSEKLLSALRNRSKWGLHIVDLRWLVDSARAEGRLDEAQFPARLPAGAAAAASRGQEQAPPNGAAAPRPARSGGKGSAMSSGSSLQAADTYQGAPLFSSATMAAAATRAQRPPDPLRSSVTSRPLSSFRQAGALLQTQSRSVKRSVRWAHPAGTSEGGTAWPEAPTGAAAAAHAAAAAGMLPAEVEQAALRNKDQDCDIDFARLPMTQAGFLPADDLLQQLRACAVAPQQAAMQASPSAPSLQLQVQQQAGLQRRPAVAAPVAAAAGALSTEWAQHHASPLRLGPSSGSGNQQAAITPAVPATSRSTPSAADVARHVQPVADGTPPLQPPSRTGLPTATLLEQLRASNAGGSMALQAGSAAAQQQGSDGVQQRQQRRLAASTDDLLAQLRASSAGQQQVQQRLEGRQALRQAGLGTSTLLEQLHASAPGQPPQQQHSSAASTEDLLALLRASALEQQAQQQAQQQQAKQQKQQQQQAQQQQQRVAASTADLLAQLQGTGTGEHMGQHQEQGEQAGRQGLDTATLLEHLRVSTKAAPHAQPLPAAQGGGRQQQLSTADLLEQLRAAGPAAHAPAAAPAAHRHAAGPAPSPHAGHADLAGALQQVKALAPGAGAPVQSGQLAASVEVLAAQLRGQPWQQQAQQQLHAQAEQGRSAEELARLLQQQRPPDPAAADGYPAAPAAPTPAAPPQQPSAAAAATPGTASGLLHKLRELQAAAPPASAAPLPLQHAPVAQPQPQPPAVPSPSIDAELPPAKYARQEERQGSLAGATGIGSMAPTEEVPAANASGDTTVVASPASSAGSPPAAKAEAAAAAAGRGGQCSPELATLASQVGNSSGRVFAGIVAVLDADLPPEEQQRVREALEQGGGRVADEGGLCRGATHVVCQPDAALKWLSMGVGIVSPQWVHRSLRSGRQQRCLAVSADTSRRLPATSAAGTPTQQRTGGDTRGDGGGGGRQQLSSELLQSREARLQVLNQLAGGATGAVAGAARATAGAGGGAAHQPATTPSELLGGVTWCVLEPPATAQLESARRRHLPALDEEDVVVVPDSEDEEEPAEGGLCCVSASQAAVQDLLQEHPAGGGSGPHPPAAVWQAGAVLPGAVTLTLLLPRDARGELGLDTRCITLPLPAPPAGGAGSGPGSAAPRQLTAGALLRLVHDYYAESLGNQEQLQLLQTFPTATGAAAVLRPAFLELHDLPRGALLGARTAFEGLRKATREPTGTVFEVLLGC